MFGKDKSKKMSENEKKAKMSALRGTHKWASDEMKKGLGGLGKVTVASDSKKGLEEGLETASELLDSDGGGIDSDHERHMKKELSQFGKREDSYGGDDDSFSDEDSELMADDDESTSMDEDELDRKIAELMSMKKSRRS
jgi:hypothetical protein